MKRKDERLQTLRELARAEEAAWDAHYSSLEDVSAHLGAFAREPLPGVEYEAARDALFDFYAPEVWPFAREAFARWKQSRDRVQVLQAVFDDLEMRGQFEQAWTEYRRHRGETLVAIFTDAPKPPLPELPSALHEQKVRVEQIAKIWGWFLPVDDPWFGKQPDVDKVQRELNEPGSVCDDAEIKRWQHGWLVQMGFELPADELVGSI